MYQTDTHELHNIVMAKGTKKIQTVMKEVKRTIFSGSVHMVVLRIG